MNIQEFVKAVQSRPQMYVEKVRVDYVYYLIIGFLGSNLINSNECGIEQCFRLHFSKWLLEWVRENKDKQYNSTSFFPYTILRDITNDEQEAVELFFELCNYFFEECDKNKDNN